MAIVDGQGAIFMFNDVPVGGIISYNVMDGTTPAIPHPALSSLDAVFLSGVAQYGQITIKIMRDYSDPGQIEMANKQALSGSREATVTGIFTLSNGVAIQFPCFVMRLPLVGNDNGLGTADAVLKIAGKVTAA